MSEQTASRVLACAGTARLARATLRADTWRIVAWAAGGVGVLVAMGLALRSSFPDDASRQAYAETIAQARVQMLFNGPGYALTSAGGQLVFEVGGYLMLAFGLVAAMSGVRHTRRLEEEGLLELVRAGPVGRLAATASALVAGTVTGFVGATALGVGLLALGMDGRGSLAYAAAVALTSAAWAAVGVLAGQVFVTARGAAALAGTLTGLAYLVRGIADARSPALRWLSPFGWAQAVRPFGDERWWPLALLVAFAITAGAAALALAWRRDLGAGLWSRRPGPARAGRLLGVRGALTVRLVRGVVAGWTASAAMLAVALGFASGELVATLTSAAGAGFGFEDAWGFVGYTGAVLAMLAAAAGVHVAAGARAEELSGRAALLLAGPLHRRRWFAVQAAAAIATTCLVAVASSAALGLGWAWGDPSADAGLVVRSAALYVVAALPLVAVALVLLATLPRRATLAWVPVIAATVLALFGSAMRIPRSVLDWTPTGAVPVLATQDLGEGHVGFLIVTAAALTAVAVWWAGRRDLAA